MEKEVIAFYNEAPDRAGWTAAVYNINADGEGHSDMVYDERDLGITDDDDEPVIFSTRLGALEAVRCELWRRENNIEERAVWYDNN